MTADQGQRHKHATVAGPPERAALVGRGCGREHRPNDEWSCPMPFPLEASDPSSLGFAPGALAQLDRLINRHIEEGRYPGRADRPRPSRQARPGHAAYGAASTEQRRDARDDTLFLMFSNTKVHHHGGAVEPDGRGSRLDQRQGFRPPSRISPRAARATSPCSRSRRTRRVFHPAIALAKSWADHALMRREVCDFSLEWTPGTNAIPPAQRPSDHRHGDRGRHRPRFPPCDP